MITGGGLVIRAMRAEFVVGEFIPEVVSPRTDALIGGAWLDAPDILPAGSMYRSEEWSGMVGRAYAYPTSASRS